ncbi:TPA: recombinase RecT [Vibrio harveyi]|nr:recombinase RecT [Vibrio harveyi]
MYSQNTQIATVNTIKQTFAPLIEKEGVYNLLPETITPERFLHTAAIAIASNPDLQDADKTSVVLSLSAAARDGLICDNKEAALVIYNENKGTYQQPRWTKVAKYMPMIDGVVKMATKSKGVLSIRAKAVYENDEFDYWMDEDGEHLRYKPVFSAKGDFKLAFCVVKMANGETIIEVMAKDDVDRARSSSKSGDKASSPWVKFYDRMAVKSVSRRVLNRVPDCGHLVSMLDEGDVKEWESAPAEKDITPTTDNLNAAIKQTASLRSKGGKVEQTVEQESNGSSEAIEGDLMPTIYDELCGLIKSCNDRQGYREVSQLYAKARDEQLCTSEELAELKNKIGALFNELRQKAEKAA